MNRLFSCKNPGAFSMFAVLLICAAGLACTAHKTRVAPTTDKEEEGERKKRWSGRSFARQTDVRKHPGPSGLEPGWDSERVWSGLDDWEPFVAADPVSDYVYQLTTRFGSGPSPVVIRRSADNGATWESDTPVGPVNQWQADPQVQVANDGTVYVVWLDGPNYETKLIKSFDHGSTWTDRVEIAPNLPWTDHAWLVISPDGKDVYIGLNQNNSYLVSSHDYGATFADPIKTSNTQGRWWLHGGGAVGPDGVVRFSVTNYPVGYDGPTDITVITSDDQGLSWTTKVLDTSEAPPDCDWSQGCGYSQLAPTQSLATDSAGRTLVVYNAGYVAYEPQQIWITASVNGTTWTPRMQISHDNIEADNAFPAVAAGPTPGDFRVVWQGNADGNTSGWNTYYRRTIDGGATWSEIVRLSDLTSGAPYKNKAGYEFPYGDYLGLSVDSDGTNHVIWGESASYIGPGGTWYTRGQ